MSTDWRKTVVLTTLVATIPDIVAAAPSQQNDDRPRIICHKGESSEAPENTLPAFRLAIDHGMPCFECDIRVSKDGGLFCYHDNDMTRFGGPADRSIENSISEELLQYDAGAYRGEEWKGLRMPQLGEILDLARDGLLIMVELKMSAEGVPLVAQEVAKHPNVTPERVMFSNGDGAVIAAVKRDLPGYKIYWIHGTHWAKEEHVVWPTTWELFQKLNACPEKPDGVFLAGQPIMDRSYWGEFKRAGYEVGIWTIDDPAEVKRYLDDGVDWVCTNYGKRCSDYILTGRAKTVPAELLRANEDRPEDGMKITDIGDWVPVEWNGDVLPGSALDFSALRQTDCPAGCHGRVVVRGDHFEFEGMPGVPQRFYGINLCGSANLPDKEAAETLAATLARTGYNAVRFHHHDDWLASEEDGRAALDPAAMGKFDALVAACVAHGLYLTTDLFVSRRVPYRAIAIDRDGFAEMAEFKELVAFHPPAYSNFLAFARNFLTHVNPHTGRRLADEPALLGLSLVNEGALGGWQTHWAWRNPCIQEAFAQWMRDRKACQPERYADCHEIPPPDLADTGNRQVQAYQEFLRDAEESFFRRVASFLRDEVKCPVPLTDMNSGFYPVGHQMVRAEGHDYIDNHFYLDHPDFGPGEWGLPARVRGENYFSSMWPRAKGPENAFLRVYGKPFTISEYNFGAPSRYRGVGGVYAGAAAALQDWGGIWRFAWSHDLDTLMHPESARIDYLNVVSDPLAAIGERAAVCLYLRGDLSPLETGVALDLPETGGLEIEALPRLHDITLDWNRFAWTTKVGISVGGRMPAGIVSLGAFPAILNASAEELDVIIPAKGTESPVAIDRNRGTLRLATSRTCAAFSENDVVHAGVLTVQPQAGIPTTTWISSLDGLALKQSKRMLLVCLTDVQQKDAVFSDAGQTKLLSWGGHPRMMRAAKTEIGLNLGEGELTLWALSSTGKRRGQIPCNLSDGILRLVADTAVDPLDATYLYEVVRQNRPLFPPSSSKVTGR